MIVTATDIDAVDRDFGVPSGNSNANRTEKPASELVSADPSTRAVKKSRSTTGSGRT